MSIIARGRHTGRLTDRVASGLADALGVPLQKAYEAAGVPRPVGEWVMPERLHRLDAEQRQLVERFAGALLEAFEKGRAVGAG
jgi:hypothetical protein